MSIPAFSQLWRRAFDAVPIGPLVQIRLALGLILLWEAYRYLANDWPQRLFLDPPFHFKYYGFGWVVPLPADWHLAVVPALCVIAVAFAIGFLYRLAACLLFVGWGYLFLLDQALYLNHMYLVVMVIGLMAFLPAHRAFSIDVLWRPKLAAGTVPRWTIDILRFQIAVVYIFGGVAKLNADWLSGVPMQIMLINNADMLGVWAGVPAVALFLAYAGMLLDLAIVPLLCWRTTRILALAAATSFHMMNHLLFQIGIFPWTMLAATYIFWPPARLSLLNSTRLLGGLVLAGMVISQIVPPSHIPDWAWILALVGGAILIFPPECWKQFPFETTGDSEWTSFRPHPAVVVAIGLFAAYQIAMPLRHFAYPGNASWSGECHRWSWHMKLRIKVADRATFYIRDQQGRLLETVDPFAWDSPLTLRQADVMSTRPDMALEFAHYLGHEAKQEYQQPVRVFVNNTVSLNGRPYQTIVDPQANLAAIKQRLWPPADWIVPLKTSRPPLMTVNVNAVEDVFDYITLIIGEPRT